MLTEKNTETISILVDTSINNNDHGIVVNKGDDDEVNSLGVR